MQQTQTYQFNILEGTDPFSVTPLNENTQKVETLLSDCGRTKLLREVVAAESGVAMSMNVSDLALSGYQYLYLDLFQTSTSTTMNLYLRINNLTSGYWYYSGSNSSTKSFLAVPSVPPATSQPLRYVIPVYGRGSFPVCAQNDLTPSTYGQGPSTVTIADLQSFDLAVNGCTITPGTTMRLWGVQ